MDTSFTQNRELSWLKFNERVLEEANDKDVKLFERLKFYSIFDSNLEEFFMVRVGTLTDLSDLKKLVMLELIIFTQMLLICMIFKI